MSRFFITGAQGCIGAWIVKNLIERNQEVFVFDLILEPKRLSLLLNSQQMSRLQFIQGDVCDAEQVRREVQQHQITHIIHLAGLQVPTCRANPHLGATVNVVGTINIFEAARTLKGQLEGLVYASSAAVFGPEEDYGEAPLDERAPLLPLTHYGVFKQCNEGNARVYFLDNQISNVGLRPYAVYGPGRDIGLTSGPTKAIKAAVVGRPYQIKFGGSLSMQFVDDTAKIFIACAESQKSGARVYNIRGAVVTVDDVIRNIESVIPATKGLLTCTTNSLGIAANLAEDGLREEIGEVPFTGLRQGIQRTVEVFEGLEREAKLDLADLES
jgi:nucleoside-diphosphate-sugar epimerase